MITSMTGFGRCARKVGAGKFTVEAKTINHKFFDLSLRLPDYLMPCEDKITELVQNKIIRGKVTISVAYEGPLALRARSHINKDAARTYYHELKALRRTLGIAGNVELHDVITLPGVVVHDASGATAQAVWPELKKTIICVLNRLTADRQKEGRAIWRDLSGRVRHIEQLLGLVRSRAKVSTDEYRQRFARKIEDLANGRTIDENRLAVEVAIFAKNTDIAEEVTRLTSHLINFKRTIAATGEAGKKIDFIAQELHREVNTIGSKASDFSIAKNVIEIKSEIEKIREQAKNVE